MCVGECAGHSSSSQAHKPEAALGAKAAVGQGLGAGQLLWLGSNCKVLRRHAPACGGVISRVTELHPFCVAQVWSISVDIHVLDSGGNLIDACCLAALAALLGFRKPQVEVDQSKGEGEAQVTVFSPEVGQSAMATTGWRCWFVVL